MKKRRKLFTDEQWKLIEPLLPEPKTTAGLESILSGRHALSFANQRGVAISSRRVSFSPGL
jgi:transposase